MQQISSPGEELLLLSGISCVFLIITQSFLPERQGEDNRLHMTLLRWNKSVKITGMIHVVFKNRMSIQELLYSLLLRAGKIIQAERRAMAFNHRHHSSHGTVLLEAATWTS